MTSPTWRQLIPILGLVAVLAYMVYVAMDGKGGTTLVIRQEDGPLSAVQLEEVQHIVQNTLDAKFGELQADLTRTLHEQGQRREKEMADSVQALAAAVQTLREATDKETSVAAPQPLQLPPIEVHVPDPPVTVVRVPVAGNVQVKDGPPANAKKNGQRKNNNNRKRPSPPPPGPPMIAPLAVRVDSEVDVSRWGMDNDLEWPDEVTFDSLPPNWVEYKTTEGRSYFVNEKEGIRTWERPPNYKSDYKEWLQSLEDAAFVSSEESHPHGPAKWLDRFAHFQSMMLMENIPFTRRLVIVRIHPRVFSLDEIAFNLITGLVFGIATDRALVVQADDDLWWDFAYSPYLNYKAGQFTISHGQLLKLEGMGEPGMRMFRSEWLHRNLDEMYPQDHIELKEFTSTAFTYIMQNPHYREKFEALGIVEHLPEEPLEQPNAKFTCNGYDELIGKMWYALARPTPAMIEEMQVFQQEHNTLDAPMLGVYSRVDGSLHVPDTSDFVIDCANPYLQEQSHGMVYAVCDRSSTLHDLITAFPDRVVTQLETRLNRDWGLQPRVLEKDTARRLWFDHFMLQRCDAMITAPHEFARLAARVRHYCPHIVPSASIDADEVARDHPEVSLGQSCSQRLPFPRH